MGFWSILGDLLASAGKAMSESTEFAYNQGKMVGESGGASGYYRYKDAKYPAEWLEAYARGYEDGKNSRK